GAWLGAAALVLPSPALAARTHHEVHKTGLPAGLDGGLVVQQAAPAELIQCLAGPGIAISNVVYKGAARAAGLFSGGAGIVGFDDGLILSTGDVANVVGPNRYDDVTASNGLVGDADLDQLVPGLSTFDAASLEFDFQCSQSSVFSLTYVFASDEY